MPIPVEELQRLLEAAFPDGSVLLESPMQDNNHFQCIVVSERFENQSRVRQHQMVYQALGDKLGKEVHAFSLQTYTPTSWKEVQGE